MMRVYLSLALIAAAFGGGWWAGAWTQEAKHIRALAAQQEADAKARARTNAAEAARLADQAGLDLQLGRVIDDARADADAGAVSLGLRDAQRLNAIR